MHLSCLKFRPLVSLGLTATVAFLEDALNCYSATDVAYRYAGNGMINSRYANNKLITLLCPTLRAKL